MVAATVTGHAQIDAKTRLITLWGTLCGFTLAYTPILTG